GDLSWNADHTSLTFTPSLAYPANTVIKNYLSSWLRDMAGNGVGSFYGEFTTESGAADTTAPTVTQVIPQDGAVDIDRSNAVVLTFSEPLDSSTLSNVGLYANGAEISTTVGRSYDNRTVTLTSSAIPGDSVISVIATNDVQDRSGNSLADFISVYSTAVVNEIARPSISSVYPGNSASDVRLDKNIVLYTSEVVDIGSVTDETLRVSQDGVLVSGSILVSGDAQVITFTPDQPWAAGSTIQVFAQSGIQNLNGVALYAHQSLFRTVADETTSALQVIASSGRSGLPSNAILGLLFNKPLDPLSVDTSSVKVYDSTQGGYVSADISLSSNNRVLELSTLAGWGASGYRRVDLTDVSDIYGNVLSSHYTNFYMDDAAIDDLVAPVVEAMLPADGATNVGINAWVRMRFSEAINPLTFNPELEDTLLQSVSFSSSNTALTYIPHEPFAASSAISLSAPTVTDNAGNALTPYSVDFTTASGVDLTGPGVESADPGPDATVPVNVVGRIDFDEPITPDSINAISILKVIRRSGYPTTFSSVAVSNTLSSDYKTVFVVPDVALAVGGSYALSVSSPRVRDLANNDAATSEVWHSFTVSFETDSTGPVLLGSSIVDGYTDVPTNAVLQLQFDESLSGAYLNGLNLLQGGSVVPLHSRVLSDGNRLVQLYVANLLEPDTAYVLRAADAVDNSGNIQLTPVDINFTTGAGAELRRLTITATSHYSGQTGVPLNTRFRVDYNQVINPLGLINPRIYDKVDRIYLPIDVVMERPDTVMIIPQVELLPNRDYQFGFTVSSLSGAVGSMGQGFTTGNESATAALDVTDWTLVDGYSAMPLNGSWVIDFSAPLDVAVCAVSDSVSINDGTNDIAYSWAVEDSNGRTRLELTPVDALLAGTNYTVTIDGLCDNAGNQQLLATSHSVTTSAETDTT
ncbi:MAG: Ig-like domain-containing protein, partial [Aestuariibacter sp.]|nr:Ig-like domain-containing protein [Aestuariibacter sp.]